MERLLAVLLVIGVIVMALAPVMAARDATDAMQQEAIDVAEFLPDRTRLARDQKFNATIGHSRPQDPWTTTQASTSPGIPVATVRADAIALHMVVRNGTTPQVLDRGAGLMGGTSRPIGGIGTHSVIAGHSDQRGRVMFDRIRELRRGDVITVVSSAGTLRYAVATASVVQPTDIAAVAPVEGKDLLTLLTCTNFDGRHHQARLLVTAERLPDEAPAPKVERKPMMPPDAEDESYFLGKPLPPGVQRWQMVHMGIAVLAFAWLVTLSVLWWRKDRT